jgi:hypothetical protein
LGWDKRELPVDENNEIDRNVAFEGMDPPVHNAEGLRDITMGKNNFHQLSQNEVLETDQGAVENNSKPRDVSGIANEKNDAKEHKHVPRYNLRSTKYYGDGGIRIA